MGRSVRLKYSLLFISSIALVLAFQNCGQVNLHQSEGLSSYNTSNIDMNLRPPTEFAWYRRYVFLVDMSYSMVSGPCPFDVDVSDSTTGFNGSAYHDYDPNFPNDNVNFSDARARVADCSVDTSFGFGQMKLDYSNSNNSSYIPDHKTFKGSDFDGNRFKVLRTWLNQMRNSNNQEFLQRTQILLIPAAGGIAYTRLLKDYPQKTFKFVNLADPIIDQSLDYLEQVHDDTAQQALMPSAERFLQYDPNLEKQKMGTTAFVDAYDSAFNLVDAEMEKLALSGDLTHSTFKLVSFTDRRINPLQEQMDKAMGYISDCADCLASLETAWGKSDDNQLETVDLKLSLLQGLTKYYGSGFFETEFVDLQSLQETEPIQYLAQKASDVLVGTEFPADQTNIISYLDQKSNDRKASSKIYKLASAEPPYRIANNNSGVTTFKTTNVFILNSDFKVDENGKGHLDTDGDGLPDDKEALYGLDPQKTRTNGICLDSLMIEPGYKDRCESLYVSKLCDPRLDSDGDGLNECEEMTIGTDPFDFDTDGDGVPDSIEVLYQMNPLVDDSKSDTNGDSLTNIMNLNRGLGPAVLPSQVLGGDLISIALNFIGQQKFHDVNLGDVKTDLFKLDLLNFPLRQSSLISQPADTTYLLRPGTKGFSEGSQISSYQNLIKPIAGKNTNKLIGLIRLIDPDEPLRVYWEIFELDMDTRVQGASNTIDLSKFSQMKVIDRVRTEK